jgi:hypothetical protein
VPLVQRERLDPDAVKEFLCAGETRTIQYVGAQQFFHCHILNSNISWITTFNNCQSEAAFQA